ncbi:hypothetical protein BDV93DRAFT_602299 [Ceratobasidium sp. AG-I]|nr:hypothetical protein BDV93DRAFT_602299 [Ceratobasidium sp. AG-I]
MKFFAFTATTFLSLLQISHAAPIKARDWPRSPLLLIQQFTAWIESHVNNLNCGDQDSIGVFQQRPSQGWGTYDQIMNVDYSTGKYLDQAIVNDQNNPGYTAGQLAQSVQRSEYPDRYDGAQSTAQDLINAAKASVGGGTTNPGTGSCSGVAAYNSAIAHLWTAKWWTQAETPSTGGSGVWTDSGAC